MANKQNIINIEVLNFYCGDNDTIILNNNFKQSIRKIKSLIFKISIEKWDLLEDLIKKLHNILNKKSKLKKTGKLDDQEKKKI